jgi:hypothetical protein
MPQTPDGILYFRIPHQGFKRFQYKKYVDGEYDGKHAIWTRDECEFHKLLLDFTNREEWIPSKYIAISNVPSTTS